MATHVEGETCTGYVATAKYQCLAHLPTAGASYTYGVCIVAWPAQAGCLAAGFGYGEAKAHIKPPEETTQPHRPKADVRIAQVSGFGENGTDLGPH